MQFQTQSWALTTVAATPSVVLSIAAHKHTVSVITTGNPATCAVQLEGSLDGTNFFSLSGTQDCSSSAMFHVVDKPVLFIRVNVTALTSGSLAVRYLGVQ